jgi:glutathione S-transferase
MKMTLTLYYHPLASFCHKVLIALYENRTGFEGRIINLGDAADRAELQSRWPLCKFPVIRDHVRQRDLPETTIIIEYLDRYFPGERPLIPGDWEAALTVRLWDRFCDNYLQGPMQRIVSDRMHSANADMTAERATLQTAYAMLDRQLTAKTWMTGDDFSMADCAAAPALFFVSTLEPIPERYGHLNGYFERLINRPSFARVIDEAKPYFSFYPFADSIPKRFR